MAVHFKGEVGSTAEAHRSSLEVAYRRIEVDGLHGAQVGRRGYGQLVAGLVGIVFAGHNLERNLAAVLEPAFAVCHTGNLAESHTVYHGYGQASHAGFVFHIKDRAVDIHAVGVGTVEHHHLLAICLGGIHQVDHSAVIGIVAQTNVLNIDYYNIEAVHHFLGRHTRAFAAVKAGDGYAGRLVNTVAHVLAGIGGASEAVFWRKEGYHIEALAEHNVEGVLVAHHAGMVREQGHALAAQTGHILGRAGSAHYHVVLNRSGFAAGICRRVVARFVSKQGRTRAQ